MGTIPKDRFEPWGGYASAPEKDKKKYEIVVGGEEGKKFSLSHWRQGIIDFLFGVWSGDLCYKKISFGSITLSLDVHEKLYYVYGDSIGADSGSYYGNYSLLDVTANQTDVECALARFAKDDHLGMVWINFPDKMLLKLWKKERRGEYGAHVMYVGTI